MTNSDNQLNSEIKFDWNKKEILEILNMPLIDLMWESQIVHRKFNKYNIQLASLFSVKTGGCEENCSYCSQSIYSASQIKSHPQFEVEEVLARAEVAKELALKSYSGDIKPSEVNEELFNSELLTQGIKDPELLIRTSGEKRISNFLLWQLAYSEIYISDVLWPDFNEFEFLKAIIDYQSRNRRFGGIESLPNESFEDSQYIS